MEYDFADVTVRHVPACGYLAIISFDDKEMYRSTDFFPLAYDAYMQGIQKLNELSAQPAAMLS